MAAIVAQALSYRYGRTLALDALDLTVPEGSMYALLGPNGSGKTTLMQILAGMRRAAHGQAHVLGRDVRHLSVADRQRIAYVAEGQRLPAWMRLDEWEAYLAPLYPTWDHALAKSLRDRFGLDPKRKLGALSRGTAMKAALLGALAPRPQLLFMDEPFTGMDVMVKDELVRGLLDSAGQEGWTVLLCSHDIAEVELVVDWMGLLRDGRMTMSESMESLQARFKRVEIVDAGVSFERLPRGAMHVERSGARTRFLVSDADETLEARLRAQLSSDARVEVFDVSLRDVFVAMSTAPRPGMESAGFARVPA